MKIIFYKKIRFKFIIAFIVLMLASFILSYAINIRVVHEGIRDTARHQFDSAMSITENFIDFIGQTAQIWVNHIADNKRLNSLLDEYADKDKIYQFLNRERISIAADTIILLDPQGQVIEQSGSVREKGDSLASLQMIDNLINNNNKAPVVTFIIRELDNFIVYSSGVLRNPEGKLQAILLVGYFISEEFLNTIKKNTQIDLAIVGNGIIMGSSKWADKHFMTELPLPYLSYQRILEQSVFANIRFMGQSYLITAKKMKALDPSFSGSILMALPAERFSDIETNILKNMARIFLCLSIIAIIIVFFISDSLLKSIKILNTVSTGLTKGHLNTRANIKSGDEFQLLAENFNAMAEEIESKNNELQQLNLSLENRIVQELEKSRGKDKLIMLQSRHAAMGEMISMIAHQWRQPLSVISMSANNILADIEFEQLEPKELEQEAQAMIKQARYLSNTIDDFRNFFQPDKKKELISPEKIIENCFELMGKSLENNNIKVTRQCSCQSELLLYAHEAMQVFLNILKNAQEALLDNREHDREVIIIINETDSHIDTIICNNGGKIDDKIITQIFEPYFSTKGKKNGTGLGLYMSKIIIEQHMDGKISAFNEQENACFKVSFSKYTNG